MEPDPDTAPETADDRETSPDHRTCARPPAQGAGGGNAVYGLGLVGALLWFWQQADGLGEHVVGVLKALVWPAFFVYEAFKAFGH